QCEFLRLLYRNLRKLLHERIGGCQCRTQVLDPAVLYELYAELVGNVRYRAANGVHAAHQLVQARGARPNRQGVAGRRVFRYRALRGERDSLVTENANRYYRGG